MNPVINIQPSDTVIIVPAYNERESLRKVISSLLSVQLYKIIVVDDGSAASLHLLVNDLPVIVIRHKVNLGQGAALQTGIDYALPYKPAYIVTFDGDDQHSTADIQSLLLPLQNGSADITLGSRFLKPGLHNASLPRQWILKAARWINYFFTGLYLSDAHNGLRAMNLLAAQKIKMKENRMAHATEFLYAIRKYRLRYREVPVNVTYTAYSKSKGQSVFNSIRIFFDLVLHKLFE